MDPAQRETLEQLLSEHHASMRRLAIRLTGSLESADEIMQEGMLRNCRAVGSVFAASPHSRLGRRA